MALLESKILDLIISKFNEEYSTEHKVEDFLIYPIQPNTDYHFGYEAKGTVFNIDVKFRLYFDINVYDQLSKFKLTSIDDDVPGEDYTFVSMGIINKERVTDDGTYNQMVNYDGSGHIDPTNACLHVTMVLGSDEW